MNASIKIYPDAEMLAADMAEVLRAALMDSYVIQGCELSVTGGTVAITSGRIVIKGRLAEVTGGNIEVPSVEGDDDGYICAVCNLSSTSSPFTLQVLPAADYNTIKRTEQNYVNPTSGNDTFNVSGGVAALLLGTVRIIAGVGATNLAISTEGKPNRNNRTYLEAARDLLQADIDAKQTAITYNRGLSDARASYLAKKSWSNSKFKIYNVTIPHFVVNAGATVKQSAPSTYGVVNTWGNGTIQSQYYDWRGGQRTIGPQNTKHTYDYTPSGNPPDYSDNIVDNYGMRTRIHSFENYGVVTLRPIGIVAASISNAKVGGKNYASCYFTQWSYTTDSCEATVHNSGKDQAIVDVTLRILYAEAE